MKTWWSIALVLFLVLFTSKWFPCRAAFFFRWNTNLWCCSPTVTGIVKIWRSRALIISLVPSTFKWFPRWVEFFIHWNTNFWCCSPAVIGVMKAWRSRASVSYVLPSCRWLLNTNVGLARRCRSWPRFFHAFTNSFQFNFLIHSLLFILYCSFYSFSLPLLTRQREVIFHLTHVPFRQKCVSVVTQQSVSCHASVRRVWIPLKCVHRCGVLYTDDTLYPSQYITQEHQILLWIKIFSTNSIRDVVSPRVLNASHVTIVVSDAVHNEGRAWNDWLTPPGD